MIQGAIANQIENVLAHIPAEKVGYFRNYFHNVPDEVMDTIRLEKRKPHKVLVEENDPIDQIFVLMEGTVKAIDYRVKRATYEYARFEGVTMLGSMECLFGIDNYMTTLVTSSPCTFLTMPRQSYESWIWKDTNALQAETKNMRGYLLDRTRENRVMLLLNGTERLIYILVKICDGKKKSDAYTLTINRQELAEQSGSSVKTVNRSIKKLEDQDLLVRDGHKVKITQRQHGMMKEYLEQISNIS